MFFLELIPVLAEPLYQAEYKYDARGLVTNLVETFGDGVLENRELDYDSLGRLRHEKLGALDVQYEYDSLGNRLRQLKPGALPQVFQYNARNELLQQDLEGLTRTLSYDLNGALTQKVFEGVTTVYDWDTRGRLIKASIDGVEAFRADYAEGLKRLRKTESSESKLYRHDNFTPIQEVDTSGVLKELVRSDRGAASVGGILYTGDESGTQTYSYNGVGSTVLLSGDDLSSRSIRYDAFGNVLESEMNLQGERLANGKEYDESIGLYFHGARYYDAEMGRYISLDPARDGVNYYVYANNAPLNYVDPLGLRNWATTAEGASRMLFGVMEAGIGAYFSVNSLGTLAVFGAGAAFVHGSLEAGAGFNQMMSGEPEFSLTQFAMNELGFDPMTQFTIEFGLGAFAGFGAAAKFNPKWMDVILGNSMYPGDHIIPQLTSSSAHPTEANLSALKRLAKNNKMELVGSGMVSDVYRLRSKNGDLAVKFYKEIRDLNPEIATRNGLPPTPDFLNMISYERFVSNVRAPKFLDGLKISDRLPPLRSPQVLAFDPKHRILVSQYTNLDTAVPLSNLPGEDALAFRFALERSQLYPKFDQYMIDTFPEESHGSLDLLNLSNTFRKDTCLECIDP